MTNEKTMKDLPKDEKPYEKCLSFGPQHLTDAELLAVLLRSGVKGMSALELSRKLLTASGFRKGLVGLYQLDIDELKKLPGIGEVKAIQIKCLLELSRRISKMNFEEKLSFHDPMSIAQYYMEDFRHCQQEQIYLLMLDTKGKLLAEKVISKGTVNASLVSPREIFLEALSHHAVSIVLLHNHPSGDPAPSREDLLLTERIREAGEILGIELLDHLILGDLKFVSLREQGFFRPCEKNKGVS
ncbi:MAG TPA: DNA repair protein RadC [Candidatus Limivivens merdigallinarum]|uniref:DNA repair protein RadC n=1 Tax=Candidatus Limivivens merdigallinarum TaxID=2840859 RepID=A0A9D0ZUW0_9FIRM|nr:DNA repair protein RadC [Candidatus Limivivens merdigallinarum]